ncbi:hypothetical protein NPIL_575831 [Nephila pilipes]|uniref:Uncharacterized protein n=1 Tax=Nephila pilipes TaxID=299642 RepID=A0A8X6QHP1_NEPPI|nr:hypothetical protein NPIL_575831 [Nephila pilipes]
MDPCTRGYRQNSLVIKWTVKPPWVVPDQIMAPPPFFISSPQRLESERKPVIANSRRLLLTCEQKSTGHLYVQDSYGA